MTRALNRLTAESVLSLRRSGRHADGGGLYASISKNGSSRRWVFLFRYLGKRFEMGLGSIDDVPLAKARELAAGCRLSVAEGRNPLAERREARKTDRIKRARHKSKPARGKQRAKTKPRDYFRRLPKHHPLRVLAERLVRADMSSGDLKIWAAIGEYYVARDKNLFNPDQPRPKMGRTVGSKKSIDQYSQTPGDRDLLSDLYPYLIRHSAGIYPTGGWTPLIGLARSIADEIIAARPGKYEDREMLVRHIKARIGAYLRQQQQIQDAVDLARSITEKTAESC